jgi:hypothetical protein
MIARRLESDLTPVVALMVTAGVLLGHALSRLPSAHLGDGGIDRGVLAELAVGTVVAVLAVAAWLADGARRSSGHFVIARVIVIGLLAGAAVTGLFALFAEAGNGCVGACG